MKRSLPIGTVLFIYLSLLTLDGFAQIRTRLTVALEDGRRASVSAFRKDDVLYVSLNEFADLLRIRRFFNSQNKKMVLRVGSRAVKVTAMNPFVLVDDEVYQMPLSTLYEEDDIFAPIGLFLHAVGHVFPAEFVFDGELDILTIQRMQYNITGVEVEEKDNGILIRFVTTKAFQVADVATSINRRWLNVTLYSGTLDTLQIATDKPTEFVDQILAFQFENSAQVSLLLNRDVRDPRVYVEEGSVLISMRSSRFDASMVYGRDSDRKRWLIDRIILDPGHGGKDPGTVSAKGILEKDINLAISQRLKRLLEDRLNIEVLMTREDDRFIGLRERTQFANSNDGKLFISIHCNANNSSRVRGYAMYILSTEKSDEALEVAEKENSVIEFEEDTEVYEEYQDAAHILNTIAQNTHLKESEDLARMICETMGKHTTLPKLGNGIFHHMFYGLVGASMPKVLVETAFLSNAVDERYLRIRANQQKIAEALFESIKRFKETYERGIG